MDDKNNSKSFMDNWLIKTKSHVENVVIPVVENLLDESNDISLATDSEGMYYKYNYL